MKFIIRVKSKRETADKRRIYTDISDKIFLQELNYEAALAKIEQIYINDAEQHYACRTSSGRDIIEWETLVFLMPRPKNLKTKSVWVKTENLKKYIG